MWVLLQDHAVGWCVCSGRYGVSILIRTLTLWIGINCCNKSILVMKLYTFTCYTTSFLNIFHLSRVEILLFFTLILQDVEKGNISIRYRILIQTILSEWNTDSEYNLSFFDTYQLKRLAYLNRKKYIILQIIMLRAYFSYCLYSMVVIIYK